MADKSEILAGLEEKLAEHLQEIAGYYTQKPKITLVIGCDWLPDGDLVMSNDDSTERVIERIKKLRGEK